MPVLHEVQGTFTIYVLRMIFLTGCLMILQLQSLAKITSLCAAELLFKSSKQCVSGI